MCNYHRWSAVIVIMGILLLTITSCGKESGERLENVFEISEMVLPETVQKLKERKTYDGIGISAENIYIGVSGNDGGHYKYYVLVVNNGGECTVFGELPMERPQNGNINISQICPVDNGTIYAFVSGYSYDADDNYLDIRELWCCQNGEWQRAEACSGLNILSMTAEDSSLLIQTTSGIKKICEDGTISDIIPEGASDSAEISNVCRIGEQIYVQMMEYTQEGAAAGIYYFDSETGVVGEKSSISEVNIFFGNGYDFYSKDGFSVYGWSQADNSYEKKEILSFGNSNIESDSLTALAPITADSMIAIDVDDRLLVLNRVPENELPLLEVITMAVMEPDTEIQKQIIDFNKTSTQYHISVKEYMGDITQLHLDMVSGSGPDILLIDEVMPYESYARQGLFVDLYSLIDKDDVLERDDFLPNVLAAYETNGKLYSIADRFGIETYSAKTSLIRDMSGWTIEEFLTYDETHEIEIFPADFDYISFVERYVQFSYNDLIDAQKGTCSFDSDAFRDVLMHTKTLSDISGEKAESQYRNDELYQTNQVLLYDEIVGSFDSYKVTYAYTFGEEAVYIGYPVESGNGALISTDLYGHEFAICSNSENIDGAWEFLRTFFTENAQMPILDESGSWIIESGFPVLRSAVDQLYDIAVSTPEMPEDQQSTSIWDVPLSKEQADKVYSLVTNTINRKRTNTEINEILRDELSTYFANGKSLDETIKVIQSRIGLYISEVYK